MPIDDAILAQTLQDLDNKGLILRAASREIDRIRANLLIIQELPDSKDPTKKVRRVDERTGAKFTDVTRQKIYDQALIDATAALA